MKQSASRQASQQQPVSAAAIEAAQWRDMMSRLRDPVVARLVIEHLDSNVQMREHFPAAYLVAKETVKREHIRYAKARDRGRLLASTVSTGAQLLKDSARASLRAATWLTEKARQAAARKAAGTPAPAPQAHRASNVIVLPYAGGNEDLAGASGAQQRAQA